jgi:hypothetical protein
MSFPWHSIIFKDGLKAYQQENDPPFLGDIRPTVDYPPGTTAAQITQFEVFDGRDWVDPQIVYVVEVSS